MPNLQRPRGFTLIEMMVGLFVGGLVSFMVVQTLVATSKIYGRISAETRVRSEIAGDFRLIETAMRGATGADGIVVRPSYSQPTQTTATGTCVYVRNAGFAAQRGFPSSNFSFYYYNATPNVPENGGVYVDTDTSSSPNPATDRVLFRGVEAFEVRTGLNQAYRLAVRAQVRGNVRQRAASAGNKIYLSTGVIRRTPPGA